MIVAQALYVQSLRLWHRGIDGRICL